MGRSGITGEISVKLTLHDIDQDRAVALVRGIAGVVHENGGALNMEGAAGLPTPMRRALGVLPPNRALPPPLGPHRGRARAEVLALTVETYEASGRNAKATAESLGIALPTAYTRLRMARLQGLIRGEMGAGGRGGQG
jgi:hypothetical protein